MNFLLTASERIRTPALLYFYLSSMIFGERILRQIQELESKFSQINFYAIDAECFPSLVQEYEIKSVPAVVLIKWLGGVIENHQEYQFKLDEDVLADI